MTRTRTSRTPGNTGRRRVAARIFPPLTERTQHLVENKDMACQFEPKNEGFLHCFDPFLGLRRRFRRQSARP